MCARSLLSISASYSIVISTVLQSVTAWWCGMGSGQSAEQQPRECEQAGEAGSVARIGQVCTLPYSGVA